MNNENIGFETLNGNAADLPEKTVLVVGVGRGGTSMVAGVLSKLGIYMGEKLSSRYQDQSLLDCMNRNDKKQAKTIIQERNQKFSIWGMKKLRLWRWNKLFREPVYIFIFRDIVATANRRVMLFEVSLLSEMFKILARNMLYVLFLRLTKRPVLIVSYEKALVYPYDFVEKLSHFLALENDPEKFTEAVNFIAPSPSEYTSTPVNHKTKEFQGYIDRVQGNLVSGWGLSTLTTQPIQLELLVNGIYKKSTIANLSRPDVLANNDRKRFHENCGFLFKMSEGETLQKGDHIEVRTVVQKVNLINSPRVYM